MDKVWRQKIEFEWVSGTHFTACKLQKVLQLVTKSSTDSYYYLEKTFLISGSRKNVLKIFPMLMERPAFYRLPTRSHVNQETPPEWRNSIGSNWNYFTLPRNFRVNSSRKENQVQFIFSFQSILLQLSRTRFWGISIPFREEISVIWNDIFHSWSNQTSKKMQSICSSDLWHDQLSS